MRTSASLSALGRMRRPQATTVSAASTNASVRSAATLRAFAAARRSAWTRGNSFLSGDSSMAAARISAGTTPAWASSPLRRGLSLASTRSGRSGLFEAIGNASLGEVIGRHLDHHLVAGQHADAVLAHLAGGMGNDLVAVLQHHTTRRVGQKLAHGALEFEQFFLCHSSSGWLNGREIAPKRPKSKA